MDAEFTGGAGFAAGAGPVYLQVVDGYDWPLLTVFVLLVVSFTVIFHALRTAIDSLAALSLKLRMARRMRLLSDRTNRSNPAVVR